MLKTAFKNRRISVSVGRTIKFGNEYEFFRFDVGMEADIPDDADRVEAHNELFKELMEDVINREAVIKAVGNDVSAMDTLVTLLKGLVTNKQDRSKDNVNINKTTFDLPPEFKT